MALCFLSPSLSVEAELKNGTGNYYAKLLGLLGKLFDGEIDQSMFEESSRYIFATKAYVVFTLDKVIQALIKNVGPIYHSFCLRR